jgi:predicted Rossmann-fold nucleotide-binding protein
MEPLLEKLVSGGQTGADRAALDLAIRHGFPHGGWCPKGRKAEDGIIPAQYQLHETPSASYLQRTERNVRDSNGTVIFTIACELSGGSKRTAEFSEKHRKPWIHLARRASTYEDPALLLQRFVEENAICILNVASTRASKEPDVWSFAYETLDAAFFWHMSHPNLLGGSGEG